jgi:nucleoside-diphosphate-sugar epimerase
MLHVSDAVSANIFAMEYGEAFDGAHFDVGTGTNISLNEVATIVQAHHPEVKFEHVAPRQGDVMLTQAAVKPLKDLGWGAEISVRAGINKCFENKYGKEK